MFKKESIDDVKSTFLAHCFPENFMTGYRIIFDREKMALGWKESDCKFIFPVLLHSYPSLCVFVHFLYASAHSQVMMMGKLRVAPTHFQ